MTLEERVARLEEQMTRTREGDMPTNRFTIGRGDGEQVQIRFRGGGSIIHDPDTGGGGSDTGGGLIWDDGGTGSLITTVVAEVPNGTVNGSNRTFNLNQVPDTGFIAINEAVYLIAANAVANNPLTWDGTEFVIEGVNKTPNVGDFFYAIYWT